MTKVVAGLIFNNREEILIAQRPKNDKNPFKWEFPGGRIERNETSSKALIREIKEELGIDIEVKEILQEITFEDIKLILFSCRLKKGRPKLLFHLKIKWVKINELKNYDFLPIDRKLIQKLDKE